MGPAINTIISFNILIFKSIFNFVIPPNGYKYIFITSIFNIFAIIKCPNSCIITKKLIIKNGINDAVIIAASAKKYNDLSISIYLEIIFII